MADCLAMSLHVHVVACTAARTVQEWSLHLPDGATVHDALEASGALAVWQAAGAGEASLGIWGRTAQLTTPLASKDRVEIYRALTVDPKVARRERFAKQGARSTGLFARQRPGGKAGY